jgi:AhpD family alkylhydroperoxidase
MAAQNNLTPISLPVNTSQKADLRFGPGGGFVAALKRNGVALNGKLVQLNVALNPAGGFTQAGIPDVAGPQPLGLQDHLDLVSFRVSQINGCAYCLDMHSKDLRIHGETEQRLYMLDAWRESPLYTDRERAALAWAEAVTNLEKIMCLMMCMNKRWLNFQKKSLSI